MFPPLTAAILIVVPVRVPVKAAFGKHGEFWTSIRPATFNPSSAVMNMVIGELNAITVDDVTPLQVPNSPPPPLPELELPPPQPTKNTDKINKGEMVKELLSRLASNEQSLNKETTNILVDKLKLQVIEQRKKNLIKSINTEIEEIPPCRSTRGSKKELKPSSKSNT